MTRGLPVSIIVHLMVLGMLAAWGGHVPPPPMEPHRILRVQIAKMPEATPQVSQPAPETDPEPVIPQIEPEPQPKPQEPVLPPKEVPRKVERKPEPELDPTPVPVQPEPDETPPPEVDLDPTPAPTASGPAISGTDVDFPFAWYLNRVEGIIARNWNPRQLGFREGSNRQCLVHFTVGRAGQISQVTLLRSSGVSLFDREALRAVKAGRLPPLPAKFPHRALGVTFEFNLQSGV